MCANLSTIVPNGSEFCKKSGLAWGKGTGEKDACFNPEDAAYSHVQIPIPRVGTKAADGSSASASSSSSTSSSSSSPTDADAASAFDLFAREVDLLRRRLWRQVRLWYRRATKAVRENPQAVAMTLVAGTVLAWFVRWLFRAGVCAAWARRCRNRGACVLFS